MRRTATPTVTRVLVESLATGAFEGLAPYLAPGVLFDATVPGWRFQLEGADAVISQLHHWWPTPARLPSHRVTATSEGAVVEFERRWVSDEGQVGCRQVHVLTLDAERIVEMRITCAGAWDEETLREIDRDAPIFR